MAKVLILVAGVPEAGKTRFAEWLARECGLALVCKDRIKETIWNCLRYDAANCAEAKPYAVLAYDLTWDVCEALMQTGQGFLCESNFTRSVSSVGSEIWLQDGHRVVYRRRGGHPQAFFGVGRYGRTASRSAFAWLFPRSGNFSCGGHELRWV